MEKLRLKLQSLLMEEMNSLSMGNVYDFGRLRTIRDICHIIMFYSFVDVTNDDLLKLARFYE